MDGSLPERYVRLGLSIGRHVDGMVDAYFGPAELAAEIEAAPPVEPRLLVAEADALLDALDDGWLRDQVVGLRTYAGVLAAEPSSYADEVEGCYGIRPQWTDEAVFAAAHERLEELLPGDGPLADRYETWRHSALVPAEQVERVLAAVIEEARAWTRRLVDLPGGEGVELEIVRDVPWMAFCGYLGDFRSKVEVNVALAQSAIEWLVLASHETYPGHHTERCCKEELLVRRRGLLEETIVMLPTPQAVVMEGIAGLAPYVLLESEGGAALAARLHDAGIEFDLEHALAVRRAVEPCEWAEVNAALMLHEQGAADDAVRAYLARWGLLNPQLADHVIRFLNQRTSRSYILTYPAGRDLCRSYVAGEPERFRSLLTEQVRVGDLLR